MTTRRTLRSGAFFGSNEETYKPKQSAVRRQHAKEEDMVAAAEVHTSSNDEDVITDGDCRRRNKCTQKRGLSFGEDKENVSLDSLPAAPSMSGYPSVSAPNTEPNVSGGSGSHSGTRGKCDILVSLLGSKHMGGDGHKYGSALASALKMHEISKTSEEDKDFPPLQSKECQSVVRTRTLNVDMLSNREAPPVSRSGLCFFSSNDHTGGSGDVLKMSELPGEAFLVSLSKDENKQLNMVKTTLGTMRVGSGLHKFMPQSYTFQDSFSKSTGHMMGKNKGQAGKWCSVSGKSRDDARDSCIPHSGQLLSPRSDLLARPHKRHQEDGPTSVSPSRSDLFATSSALSRGNVFDNMAMDVSICEPISPNAADCFISKPAVDPLHYTHGEFLSGVEEAPSNEQRVSQYPHMEEILTHQSYEPNMSRESHHGFMDIPEAGDGIARPPRKAISLLKTPISSMTPLSPMLETNRSYESSTFVKRSERLRCRTESKPTCTSEAQQPVISTMKPATLKCKIKFASGMSKKKKKVPSNPSGKNGKKKKAKKRGDNKSGTGKYDKSRDASRRKQIVSREVMDGIVQSIEETVSRVAQERVQTSPLAEASPNTGVSGTDESPGQHAGVPSRMESPVSSPLESSEDIIYRPESEGRVDESTKLCLVSAGNTTPPHIIGKRKTNKSSKSKSKHKASKKFQKSVKVSLVSKLSKSKKSKSKELELPLLTEETASIECQPCELGDGFTSSAESQSTHSKRLRKKTRKAVEALGDDDGFLNEDLPAKKSKSKKRSSDSSSERSSSGPRRPRRSGQNMYGMMADPVLGEHAFILWASEHRSEIEQHQPEASTTELDAILSARWAQVPDTAKARFFLRARDAVSDEDRLVLADSSPDLDSATVSLGPPNQEDPVYNEFVQLSEHRQRVLLRKWLKFFQKIFPRADYAEFLVGFKRACGRDGTSLGEGCLRTQLCCLDPVHYKTLFDIIRLTKPLAVEVCRQNRGRGKKLMLETYSLMLRQLLSDSPWPHMQTGCRSVVLTQLLDDLQSIQTESVGGASGSEPGTSFIQHTLEFGDEVRAGVLCENDKEQEAGPCAGCKDKSGESEGAFVPLEDWDCRVLSSSLATSLLEELSSQTGDLPVLDQNTLDEVFLAPPSPVCHNTIVPQRRYSGGGPQSWRGGHSPVTVTTPRYPPSLEPGLPATASPRPTRTTCFLTGDLNQLPKVNTRHLPACGTPGSGVLAHHHPSSSPSSSSSSTSSCSINLGPLSLRAGSSQGPPPNLSVCSRRKESPMDMHSYSISMENLLHCSAHSPHAPSSRGCVNTLSAKSVSSTPLPYHGPPVAQPPALSPCSSHARYPPHHHATSAMVGPGCGAIPQRFSPHIYPTPPGTSPLMEAQMSMSSNKLSAHHMYPVRSPGGGVGPRMYPSSVGLMNSPGPLITSLSPLRGPGKAGTAVGGPMKSYSTHCHMVPYRQHVRMAGAGGHSYRKTAHSIPISTTLKTGVGRGQSNLQQIKVCMPTQALKIPIAKLRGGRKSTSSSSSSSSQVKGKMKNVPVSSTVLEGFPSYTNSPSACRLPCARAGPNSHSVLAKVLGIQLKGETDNLAVRSASSTSLAHPQPFCPSSMSCGGKSPQLPTSFPCTPRSGVDTGQSHRLVHSTGPVVKPYRGTQEVRSGVSPGSTAQTAVVISPLQVHRRSLVTDTVVTSTPTSLVVDTTAVSHATSATHDVLKDMSSFTTLSFPSSHIACGPGLTSTPTLVRDLDTGGCANSVHITVGPSVLTTESSVLTPGPSILTTGPSILTPGPSVFTSGPTVLTTGPTVLTPGPSVLTTGPSTSTKGPSTLTMGPSVLTPGPSAVTTGPSILAQELSAHTDSEVKLSTANCNISTTLELRSYLNTSSSNTDTRTPSVFATSSSSAQQTHVAITTASITGVSSCPITSLSHTDNVIGQQDIVSESQAPLAVVDSLTRHLSSGDPPSLQLCARTGSPGDRPSPLQLDQTVSRQQRESSACVKSDVAYSNSVLHTLVAVPVHSKTYRLRENISANSENETDREICKQHSAEHDISALSMTALGSVDHTKETSKTGAKTKRDISSFVETSETNGVKSEACTGSSLPHISLSSYLNDGELASPSIYSTPICDVMTLSQDRDRTYQSGQRVGPGHKLVAPSCTRSGLAASDVTTTSGQAAIVVTVSSDRAGCPQIDSVLSPGAVTLSFEETTPGADIAHRLTFLGQPKGENRTSGTREAARELLHGAGRRADGDVPVVSRECREKDIPVLEPGEVTERSNKTVSVDETQPNSSASDTSTFAVSATRSSVQAAKLSYSAVDFGMNLSETDGDKPSRLASQKPDDLTESSGTGSGGSGERNDQREVLSPASGEKDDAVPAVHGGKATLCVRSGTKEAFESPCVNPPGGACPESDVPLTRPSKGPPVTGFDAKISRSSVVPHRLSLLLSTDTDKESLGRCSCRACVTLDVRADPGDKLTTVHGPTSSARGRDKSKHSHPGKTAGKSQVFPDVTKVWTSLSSSFSACSPPGKRRHRDSLINVTNSAYGSSVSNVASTASTVKLSNIANLANVTSVAGVASVANVGSSSARSLLSSRTTRSHLFSSSVATVREKRVEEDDTVQTSVVRSVGETEGECGSVSVATQGTLEDTYHTPVSSLASPEHGQYTCDTDVIGLSLSDTAKVSKAGSVGAPVTGTEGSGQRGTAATTTTAAIGTTGYDTHSSSTSMTTRRRAHYIHEYQPT